MYNLNLSLQVGIVFSKLLNLNLNVPSFPFSKFIFLQGFFFLCIFAENMITKDILVGKKTKQCLLT